MHGLGFLNSLNDTVYYGEFNEGIKHGVGIEIHSNGEAYNFNWKSGHKGGNGF